MRDHIVNRLIDTSRVNLCVPLCGSNIEELKQEIALLESGIDMVEWRMDCFCAEMAQDWIQALKKLRPLMNDYVLLATWRSEKEGGRQNCAFYEELLKGIIQSGLVDMIDIELFQPESCVKDLTAYAHEHHVAVVISNHATTNTPDNEAMMIRLQAMRRMGADIVKLAVMPNTVQDVWRLLETSTSFHEQVKDCYLVTMAMGEMGVISRICAEMSGSIISFAALKEASAPGQLPWKQLEQLLHQFHQAYQGKKAE